MYHRAAECRARQVKGSVFFFLASQKGVVGAVSRKRSRVNKDHDTLDRRSTHNTCATKNIYTVLNTAAAFTHVSHGTSGYPESVSEII